MPEALPFLPFALPEIGDEEIAEVVDTLKSGWVTTGPKAKRFEQEQRHTKFQDSPYSLEPNLKEGAGGRLEEAFARARRATRQEKGNLTYDLNRDAREPTHYLVYER